MDANHDLIQLKVYTILGYFLSSHSSQLLITFDHDKLKAMNYEDVIMLVLLNPGNAKNVKFVSDQPVQAKDSVIATFE